MQALSIARLGADKRGNPRIWLEGKHLARAGFTPAARYELIIDEEQRAITLRLAANGERLVSRKMRGATELPVIDLANSRLLEPFEGLENVTVRFSEGAVTISPRASDLRRLARIERLRNRLKSGQPLAVGSVSTGLGVLALAMHQGLEAAGLQSDLKFSVEIDERYIDQCALANPAWGADTIPVNAPMQEVAFDATALQALPKVDILEAGIPCTAHSLAGRAKKALAKPEDDPNAGHLVAGFLAIVAAVNPAIVLVENVPQYLTSASFAILSNQLKEWGYDVQTTVLRGADFGCIEHRNRMAMIAMSEGIDFDLDSLIAPDAPSQRLGDFLEDIPTDSPLWSTMSYLREKEERDIAAGKGFRMQTYDADAEKIGTVTRGYGKVRSTDPKVKHPTDPQLLRQLTPIEHARIKGVPEEMIAGLSVTAAHEMLGQSILARPFRALADHIGNALVAWLHGVQLPRVTKPLRANAAPAPLTDLPLFA